MTKSTNERLDELVERLESSYQLTEDIDPMVLYAEMVDSFRELVAILKKPELG